jgi:hypothetical protein
MESAVHEGEDSKRDPRPSSLCLGRVYGAVIANTDVAKLRAIMGFKGLGAYVDEDTGVCRAKVASSVLRYCIPTNGVFWAGERSRCEAL